MKIQILLDTNFIIACIRQKFQFIEEIRELGESIVPIQVIKELKRIITDKDTKLADKEAAKLAIRLLKKYKIKTIDLKNEYVDQGILDYIDKTKNKTIIATLDKNLKKEIKKKAKVLIIRTKKKLEVI